MADAVEILASDDAPVRSDAIPLYWPTEGRSDAVESDLDWNLSVLGNVDPAALDLARVAGAAYLADRSVRRSDSYFSRRLRLIVHVDQPEIFLSPTGQRLVDLLAWLTGDAWTLTPVPNNSKFNPDRVDVPERATVQLLSGGLDSLCAAALDLSGRMDRLYLGHRDNTRAVARSQERIAAEITGLEPNFAWLRARFVPRKSIDSSTRTRSLLFMALAVAAATASEASAVLVPENGFTSLNVPLIPSRGGALSTKSTHPWTFIQANLLMQELGLDIQLANPHAQETKGQMLARASAAGLEGFTSLVKETTSCSKMDGGMAYKGGNPNVNCGLCIACLVRRGAFVGAELDDPTTYLIDIVEPEGRAKLLKSRRTDIWAVQTWSTREPSIDDLMVSAPWPPGIDYEKMLDVVNRGRSELLGALSVAI